MKKIITICLILTVIILAAGCKSSSGVNPAPTEKPVSQKTPVELDEKLTEKIVSSYSNFGFNLFSKLCGNKGKNIFISPSSIAIALSMTYNGAKNKTKTDMAKTLGVDKIDENKFNEGNMALIEYLMNADSGIELSIANSLWCRPGIKFYPDFIKKNQDFYDAEISNKFDEVSINNWVNEKTKGKIPEVIDKITEDAILFLINAIYFKGNWSVKFNKENTKEQDFYLLNKTAKLHPLMHQHGNYNYYKGDKFQAVELPYGDKKTSMFVFLPDEKYGISQFQKELNNKNWQKWMNGFHDMEGDIALPKFKIEYEVSLNDTLKELGMEEAFDKRKADFHNMCEIPPGMNVFISKVTHKTFVDVNEEGTEAAAVTVVQMDMTDSEPLPPKTFTMIVDHPFFFAIVDKKTGTILFMGSIVEP